MTEPGFQRRALLFALSLLCLPPVRATDTSAPELMLAKVYRGEVVLADYWVSEKYDGVRGYWDGSQLLTRGGRRIAAPAWFTAGWPAVPLDGELWAGRGRFEKAQSTVARESPDDTAWRGMRYMVFDLPAHPGSFDERLTALDKLIGSLDIAWLRAVAQRKIADRAALLALMKQTVRAGGEGLMLHRGASLYRGVRSDDLLKLKPYEDAEAIVVAHLPGRGKFAGMLGALVVQTPAGVRFNLGTGFSDAQRRDPPPVGSTVTYRYVALNASGVPRHARFLRVRRE
ncbi:MAG: DNA ligase [Burkholderiales bacterium]